MKAKTQEQLAAQGQSRIMWTRQSMPVLGMIEARFAQEKPLEGIRLTACLHVTAETGALMQVLKAGGAEIRLCASNPLSTQDDVVASLQEHDGIEVYAQRGVDRETYYAQMNEALGHGPHLTMDDGADVVNLVHTQRRELLADIIGGTEETTTGVIRLRSMAHEGMLSYPVFAVNDASTKHLFDNRYGTGQSTIDGILRATNRLLAGAVFVVAGYGWCSRGIAMRAAGMGARVIVTEIDPMRALEAVMDGYQAMPMQEAAALGDFFCTATGNIDVLQQEHFAAMKDGAILCNAGHFNVEIQTEALKAASTTQQTVRPELEEYTMADGRRLYLLAQGRLVNLAAAEGHPPNVMDMSFANQALCAEALVKGAGNLTHNVHGVPREIDENIARMKLESMNVHIDTPSAKQTRYQNTWKEGT